MHHHPTLRKKDLHRGCSEYYRRSSAAAEDSARGKLQALLFSPSLSSLLFTLSLFLSTHSDPHLQLHYLINSNFQLFDSLRKKMTRVEAILVHCEHWSNASAARYSLLRLYFALINAGFRLARVSPLLIIGVSMCMYIYCIYKSQRSERCSSAGLSELAQRAIYNECKIFNTRRAAGCGDLINYFARWYFAPRSRGWEKYFIISCVP